MKIYRAGRVTENYIKGRKNSFIVRSPLTTKTKVTREKKTIKLIYMTTVTKTIKTNKMTNTRPP